MIYKTRSTITHLDIILLTCNFLDDTKKCIESLYTGDPNFALTIVDNGSQDGSVDYLKEVADSHDNVTLDLQKINLGVVKGRNHGYEISKGISPSTDYIMFLDNDQTAYGDWKAIYMNYMQMGFDIVGSEAWKIDKRRMMPVKHCIQPTEEYSYVGCGGMMIKHHVIQDIGLFDEQFSPMYFEDPNFCWEAYKAGYRILWRPGIISHNAHNLLEKDTGVDRRIAFYESHRKFHEKWKGFSPPSLKIPPKALMTKMATGV